MAKFVVDVQGFRVIAKHTMASSTKIFAIEIEGDTPEYVGPINYVELDWTYANLRDYLQNNSVLDWQFQFWDIEESSRIRVKLERLNTIPSKVYVIQDSVVGERLVKCPRVGDASVVFDSIGTGVSKFPDCDPVEIPDEDGLQQNLASTSVVSHTETTLPLLNSKVISKDVLQWYTKGEDKLRKDLAHITLEDHIWMLKSWDQNGVAVVKLWCEECKKSIGGDSGDHTKAGVTNLFSNFKKSHIMSVGHAKNYCRCKGIEHLERLSTIWSLERRKSFNFENRRS